MIADGRALFDQYWYRAHAGEIDGDPYDHFVTVGRRAGIDPHPLFSLAYYDRQTHGAVGADENPLEHYLLEGARAGASPHILFDPGYYTDTYGSTVGDHNSLVHYLADGARLGLDPSPFFASAQYLESNPDVRTSGMNPLVHYACAGGEEWIRAPHPQFDAAAYARRLGLGHGVNPLVHFLERLATLRQRTLERYERPDVSAVIVNFNKAQLTLQCIVELLEATGAQRIEVVVVDNGSLGTDFSLLTTYLPDGVKLVRVGTNRYFGEGNNIGVEASNGRYLLLLNNDAFVGPQSLESLLNVFAEYPDAGAVGPKFVYPDGTIQECGGFVMSCGTAVQRGKGLDDRPGRYDQTETVDYVSAACVLVRRDAYDRAGGFDFSWDPAYYEDVDLCFKIALQGGRTYYCGRAVVTHLEKATSSDVRYGLSLDTVVPINREKFICRWSPFIESGRDPASAPVALAPMLDPMPSPFSRTAVLYRPEPLVADQPAAYLLALARLLSQQYNTYLVMPGSCSTARLRAVAADLEIDVPRLRVETHAALGRFGSSDVFVAAGDQVFPPVAPSGRRRIFVCTFPTALTPEERALRWGWLSDYDDVLVHSAFAQNRLQERAARLGVRLPPTTVLPPMARNYRSTGERSVSPVRILNTDRFSASGRERIDVLVESFRTLLDRSGRDDLELHLAGSVDDDPAARDRCLDVRRRARGLPIVFHLNPPPAVRRELHAGAVFSWHATGYGEHGAVADEWLDPAGSAVAEAMSGGVIPIAFAGGAIPEIVSEGHDGAWWQTPAELLQTTIALLDAPPAVRHALRRNAIETSRAFDQPSFEARVRRLFEGAPDQDGGAVAPVAHNDT